MATSINDLPVEVSQGELETRYIEVGEFRNEKFRMAGGGMSIRQDATAPIPLTARQGVRDSVVVIIAYLPFGLALGATLAATGVHPLIAWSSSPLLFGGAAQLLAVELLDAGASAAVIILGALVVNARMLLYSASLAPYTRAWRGRWRWLRACFLNDPVYVAQLINLPRLVTAKYRRIGQISVTHPGWLIKFDPLRHESWLARMPAAAPSAASSTRRPRKGR